MQKMQAIGAPFVIEHSSNSDLKPKHFDWSMDDQPIKVFIDGAILVGINYEKKAGERKIAWVCESRAIFHSMHVPIDIWQQSLFEVAQTYDYVFVSDKQLTKLAPNILYCPSGSNLPWAKEQKIFDKTKLISLIASPKKFTFGHVLRHQCAERFQGSIDLFGGVLNSKRIGSTPWDKSEALNDYMFQIVIENDKYSTYYTEKLTDCFATGTIPIYWGAPDIGDIFNSDGIIQLTPDFDPKSLTRELYESKIEAIKENFNRVKELVGADDQLFKLLQ